MRGDRAGIGRRWRVGELARVAGVSVRTLRHYDAIGLLRPAQRSASGYREYTSEDVHRLYRVLALRRLGLSLDEIREAVESGSEELLALVERQLARVDDEIRVAEALRARLERLADALQQHEPAPFTVLLDVLEVMAMTNTYYTPEQLADLEQRAAELGPEGMRQAESAWATLIEEMDAARRRGDDPTSSEVQALAQRWQALIEQFTGGDPGIRSSLQRMYESEGPEAASRGTMNADLMAYAQQALAALG
ncbi:MAG: MerR family transcriptional regulator [Dehalococcoidia bacterium]|nr:MerR family transcriptional regulator [Dehalococcoidia bacterium]